MAKNKINVLVICGGPSNEREVSLKTGLQIAKALPKDKYRLALAEISKEGKWFLLSGVDLLEAPKSNSKALIPAEDSKEFKTFDVAFVGMHGYFGEDGRIQALLETIGIPYTGSGVLASALGMNKLKTLEIVGRVGVSTPKFLSLHAMPSEKNVRALQSRIKKEIGYPCIVKPNESGSSIGISIVRKPKDLVAALQKAFNEDRTVLIEEYIKGEEITCAIMGNTGQTELTALPPIEIIPAGEFFDYDSKYFALETKEICPARITKKQTKAVQKLAQKVHATIGCDGLSRSDFILTAKGKFYFLEINTIPGLTEVSLAPKAASAHGMPFPDFLDAQIKLAIAKKNPQETDNISRLA